MIRGVSFLVEIFVLRCVIVVLRLLWEMCLF